MGRLESERNSSVEQKKNRSANTWLFPIVPISTADKTKSQFLWAQAFLFLKGANLFSYRPASGTMKFLTLIFEKIATVS